MSDSPSLDTRNLQKLLKILKGKLPVAKVGIMGGKVGREDSNGPTNAEVGAAHEYGTKPSAIQRIVRAFTKLEFGSIGTPQRSFLRMPLTTKMQKYIDSSGAYSEESIKEMIQSGSAHQFTAKLGILGESIVMDAFDSEGFGQWKKSDMRYKKNQQTLTETGQLRSSITSEVED